MIKIVALFAVVAACNAGYIQQQYVYPQQPALTIAHQPTYLTHGAHFGYPLQFAVAAPAPTSPPAPAPAPTTPAPPPPPPTTTAAPEPEPFDPNPQYTYSYQVDDAKTDDHKSATETRNGDAVSGKYTVVEPDGTLRTVTYTADKDGFVADVQRDAPKSAAPAPTPAPVPAPAPVVPVKPTFQYFTVPAQAYRPLKTISTFVQPQLIAQPHHIVAHQPHVFASHGHYSPYVLH